MGKVAKGLLLAGLGGIYLFGHQIPEDLAAWPGYVTSTAASAAGDKFNDIRDSITGTPEAERRQEAVPDNTIVHIGKVMIGQDTIHPLVSPELSGDVVRTVESGFLAIGAGGVVLARRRSNRES